MPFNFQHLNLCELALHSKGSGVNQAREHQKAEIELMNGNIFQNQAANINFDFSNLTEASVPLFFEKHSQVIDCQNPFNPDNNSN